LRPIQAFASKMCTENVFHLKATDHCLMEKCVRRRNGRRKLTVYRVGFLHYTAWLRQLRGY
jgi:1,2-phenylacetyl-CoA epoxidase catalytic subunit